MMFLLQMVGLTLVCIGVTVGIMFIIARLSGCTLMDVVENFFDDNNRLFYWLCGVTTITFVIACFHWGPPLFVPDAVTPNRVAKVGNFWNHFLHGKNAVKVVPEEPLPWAGATWFWWKALAVYAALTTVYGVYAFSDEVAGAFNAARSLFHRRRTEHAAATSSTPGFLSWAGLHVAMSAAWEFIEHLIRARAGRTTP